MDAGPWPVGETPDDLLLAIIRDGLAVAVALIVDLF